MFLKKILEVFFFRASCFGYFGYYSKECLSATSSFNLLELARFFVIHFHFRTMCSILVVPKIRNSSSKLTCAADTKSLGTTSSIYSTFV
jgi:hypothetical protein